jgi:serine protease AprX
MRNFVSVQRWERVHLLSFLLLIVFFSAISLAQSPSTRKYWVYLKDKGPGTAGLQSLKKGSIVYESAKATLSSKALLRRGKVLREENLIDASDLPVHQAYIEELGRRGVRVMNTSRWFNAVSGYLTDEEAASIRQLPFVKEVTPVATFTRDKEPMTVIKEVQPPSVQKSEALNYGPSLEQSNVINIPLVHSLDISAKGVLIGMLDTGFRWKTHEALKNIRVLAEYDFIFHDSITANEAQDSPGQDGHGTTTLSTIGGFMPGQLIGPAYGATFILGKTEYVPTETQIEEDNWVAGIEWMESLGVDVVSSSLGYTTFDDGSGYSYARGDFNGRTAVTSKAAVAAARKGVVVVNSMGNEGNSIGSIIAPADADSIISVGAVNFSGVLASFSSVGPTNDRRTKPDVVAPGVGIYVASTGGEAVYGRASGTSYSCPLTAGVAALVLSAHPEYSPIQVRNAIRNTASRAFAPDNFYGWGVVNAGAAVLFGGIVFSNVPHLYFNDSKNIVSTFAASAIGVDELSIFLHYSLDGGQTFSPLQMVSTTTPNLFVATIPTQPLGTSVSYYIDGVDQGGHRRSSPYDAPTGLFSFRYGEGDTTKFTPQPVPPARPTTFVLYQNFPNPFNPGTTIKFYSPEEKDAEVVVYNMLGQKTRILFNGRVHPGNNYFQWDGRDESGRRAASGVYFYRIRTGNFSDTKRMLLVK